MVASAIEACQALAIHKRKKKKTVRAYATLLVLRKLLLHIETFFKMSAYLLMPYILSL